ncbi:MAG TPA: TrkA family potassium uptake protein [Bacteroidota bacterium]|nr:TrkA family potassium uptake protein [Bacteroidota bacterium]
MGRRFAVIGLGHFGSSLASALTARNAEVLAIDNSIERLDDVKEHVAHTIRLDTTEERALRGLGLQEMDGVVVAIGDDFEATLLTVSQLQQLSIRRIIVRATTPVHERILDHLGITEIILPSVETAERLSNSLMMEGVVDSLALGSDYTIMEVNAPEWMLGTSLQELRIREKYEVSLVTIQREETRRGPLGIGRRTSRTVIGVPLPTTVVERGDTLVLFGTEKQIQKLITG